MRCYFEFAPLSNPMKLCKTGLYHKVRLTDVYFHFVNYRRGRSFSSSFYLGFRLGKPQCATENGFGGVSAEYSAETFLSCLLAIAPKPNILFSAETGFFGRNMLFLPNLQSNFRQKSDG